LNKKCLVLNISVTSPSTANFMYRRETDKQGHNKGKWYSERDGKGGSNTAPKVTKCSLTNITMETEHAVITPFFKLLIFLFPRNMPSFMF